MASISATKRRDTIVIHLLVIPLALIWLFPIFTMVIYATIPDSGIYQPEIRIFPGDQLWANLGELQQATGFMRTMINSFVVGIIYAILSIILTSMAGWSLARYHFRGKAMITLLVLGTMAMPYFALVIPQFIMVARDFHLSNTWFALIVPPLFNALGVLFMRQAFTLMPNELFDAARVEGVSEWKIYLYVAIPMARPMMAALGIILFLASWNNYLWPLLINTQADMMTAPVAVGSMIGATNISWGAIMAGSMVLTLPMLVLFTVLQRHFISGITAGAVK